MDQSNINEAMKLIAYFSLCTTLGLGIGVYIFGHKIKMQREYFERRQKDHARYFAKEFEEQHLDDLANNLIVRGVRVEDDFGKDFDMSRIPPAFNPYGRILVDYLNSNHDEKNRLKQKLENLICRE